MAVFKLGIFLMVIIGDATLESANGDNKENINPTSEPKLLHETKEDKTSSNKRGFEAGSIVSAGSFGLGTLTTILDVLGNIERKVAIGVDNNSGYNWQALNVYFYSGTSEVSLPDDVPPGKALLFNAQKVPGPKARGCVGVISYYIPDLQKTLSVMFSDPYDQNLYGNWWSVALSTGKAGAELGRYKKMYHGTPKPFKGDDTWHERNIGDGLMAEGNMASSGTPTLQIRVKKA